MMASSPCGLLLPMLTTLLLLVLVRGQEQKFISVDNPENRNDYRSDMHRHHLPRLETDNWRRQMKLMADKNISLQVFYHTSRWQGHWKQIIIEHMLLLDGKRTEFPVDMKHPVGGPPRYLGVGKKTGMNDSTLQRQHENRFHNTKPSYGGLVWSDVAGWAAIMDYAKGIYINTVGSTATDSASVQQAILSLPISFKEKISWNYNRTINRGTYSQSNAERRAAIDADPLVSEGEITTINKMHTYCKEQKRLNKKAFILYFHNKGAQHVRRANDPIDRPNPVASWREFMNVFAIEYPSICTRALQLGYTACGAENQDGSYSGNFFWGDCDHVAELPEVWTRFDAWAIEYFVFNVSFHHHKRGIYGENCGYNAYRCVKIDHYAKECPRRRFRDTLATYITQGSTLPPNIGSTMNGAERHDWVKDKCGNFYRQGPYVQNPVWREWEKFPFKRHKPGKDGW